MKTLFAALLLLATMFWQSPVHSEGVVPTPWGWRAAPCCRDRGLPGYQGRPPGEFLYGALAPIFWGEIVPRLMERFPPPPAYPAYAPPVYRRPPPPPPDMASPAPPPPAAAPLDREQWKQQIFSEGRRFCEAYPDDPVCNK